MYKVSGYNSMWTKAKKAHTVTSIGAEESITAKTVVTLALVTCSQRVEDAVGVTITAVYLVTIEDWGQKHASFSLLQSNIGKDPSTKSKDELKYSVTNSQSHNRYKHLLNDIVR